MAPCESTAKEVSLELVHHRMILSTHWTVITTLRVSVIDSGSERVDLKLFDTDECARLFFVCSFGIKLERYHITLLWMICSFQACSLLFISFPDTTPLQLQGLCHDYIQENRHTREGKLLNLSRTDSTICRKWSARIGPVSLHWSHVLPKSMKGMQSHQ